MAKKQQTGSADRFAKMRELAEKINKSDWGGRNKNIASVLGDDTVVSNVERFTSTNMAIDWAMGGGVPKGKIVELWGGESAGKSTLVYHIMGSHQKTYPEEGILLLDTEHSYDPLYAEALGVDAKGIIYVEAESGIGALNIAKMACESDSVGLIVIDSIAALTTKSDDKGVIGDQTVAEQARMISQAFRVINSVASHRNITVIVTNQIREKIGVMFGSPDTTPAGRALKHYAHIRGKMTRTKQIKGRDGEIIGVEGRFDCVKNKVSPPFRKAKYTITFGMGIDPVISAVELALEHGIIRRKGAWYIMPDNVQYQGMAGLLEMLRKDENADDLKSLEDAVRERLSGNATVSSAGDGQDESDDDISSSVEDV